MECISWDMSNPNGLPDLSCRTDVVIHLASSSVPAMSNLSDAMDFHSSASLPKLLEECCRLRIPKFVFFSTSAVYGNEKSPFRENSPAWPVSVYAVQKLFMEKVINLFRNEHGLNAVILRPSNPYGPYQVPGIQGVISSFVRKALLGDDLEIVGDGSVERDFIYIDDLVTGVIDVLGYDGEQFVFNLGSGKAIRILEVAKEVKRAIPGPSKIVTTPGRASDAKSNVLDMTLFHSEIGKLACTPLSEGIIKTADYQKLLIES